LDNPEVYDSLFKKDSNIVSNDNLKGLPDSSYENFSIDNAYLSFDIRDSYLQRQANYLATKADTIIISTDDYETQSCNIWRSPENSSIYTVKDPKKNHSTALDFYTGGKTFAEKVSINLLVSIDKTSTSIK
jgi:hypothetical protein